MTYFAITGRLQQLSVAELEAVFGAQHIEILTPEIVRIEQDEIAGADFHRLGGVLKLGRLLNVIPDNWAEIEEYLFSSVQEHSTYVDGKLNIGISTYGMRVPVARIHKTLLGLKKQLKKSGKSVRVLLNKEPTLSTAEVYHNKLTGKNGWELLVIQANGKTYLAQTTHVQDIDSYVMRDRGRPKRDSRVGMLPPKLAQTIINLATGAKTGLSLLDPFCGTGVVLQEALLMGNHAYGTDLEPRMVEYTRDNLQWLSERSDIDQLNFAVEAGDATKHQWQPTPDCVAGETYLGPPLTSYIPDQELLKMIGSVNKLHEDFFKNIAPQLKSGARLCLAVPAWRRREGYKHLPVLEKLGQLGYNWVKLEHVDSHKLIYDRPDQFVARQLITITKQ